MHQGFCLKRIFNDGQFQYKFKKVHIVEIPMLTCFDCNWKNTTSAFVHASIMTTVPSTSMTWHSVEHDRLSDCAIDKTLQVTEKKANIEHLDRRE